MLTIMLALAVVAGEPPHRMFAGRVWGVDMASHSLIVRGVDYPLGVKKTNAIPVRRTVRIDGWRRIYLHPLDGGEPEEIWLDDVFRLHDRVRDSDVVLWGRYDRDIREMDIWIRRRATMSDFTDKHTKGGQP